MTIKRTNPDIITLFTDEAFVEEIDDESWISRHCDILDE